MTKTQSTVISVKGDDFIQKEALGNEVLSPGHLLELLSTGKVQKVATAAATDIAAITEFKTNLVALENSILGEGVTDAYADGDTVKYAALKSGQEVLLRFGANAAAVVIGDTLESAANAGSLNGTVKIGASATSLFIAKEAVDNNANGSEVFILAEVI